MKQKTLVLKAVGESDNFTKWMCAEIFPRVRRNGTSEEAPVVAGKVIHLAKPFAEGATRIEIVAYFDKK